MGMVRTARARKYTLATIAAPVSADGHRRVKPSVYLSPTAHTTSSSPARVSQIHAMPDFLDEDRAPAVDRDDLSGDVGRAGEEVYRLRDVLGRADAPERRAGDDARALAGLELAVVRPGDRPGGHAVHAHLGRELERERARERGEARLGDAVDRVALERALGMDVDDVDYGPGVLRQLGRRLLADEHGRAQVRADQLLPVRGLDRADLDRKEAGGIVHQQVEAAEGRARRG